MQLDTVVKSYDIARYTVEHSAQGWIANGEFIVGAAWIVFGGIVSLLSGCELIKIMLKYME